MINWERWELKGNPYNQDPIHEFELDLFVGREKELKICRGGLATKNVRIVIEGSRGVGTTSLGNYLRYTLLKKKDYFTPIVEIALGKNWNQDMLLANTIAALCWSLEQRHPEIIKDREYKETKMIIQQVQEKYKSYGAQILGFGAQYGRTGSASQPAFFPTLGLIQYFHQIRDIIAGLGYQHGILIQLNNLDLKVVHQPEEMRQFLNASRDIFQISGYNWLIVGDLGLRGFIASEVDRLDDIITIEVSVEPLDIDNVKALIEKRMRKYALGKNYINPINFEVISYLHNLTSGRLRYIFGMCTRLLNILSYEQIIERVDLEIARPIIAKLAEDRIKQRQVSASSIEVLRYLVKMGKSTPTEISKGLGKAQTAISRSLAELVRVNLTYCVEEGRRRIYYPQLDAKVAYLQEQK